MKRLILCSLLLSAAAVYAQTGQVNYTRTIAFGEIAVDGIPPELTAMLPKEDKANYVLYFMPTASLYESVVQTEKEEKEMSGEGFRIRIQTDQDEDKCYTDIANRNIIEQRALSGRMFLITNQQKERKWKMTGNQKKMLDHVVMEAVSISGKDTVEAWYAPDIAIATGPQGITGLPGLILEATINKKQTIQATAIKMDAAVASKIVVPTKGKKLSAEAFDKLEKQKHEEQIKELQASGEGGKRIMIVR
ncbi:MAG TPA: GLPGLI family protein [Flavipsychrobacter sp.]|nr:GLPGLI family protein [Flavipsychrobacter sp.]